MLVYVGDRPKGQMGQDSEDKTRLSPLSQPGLELALQPQHGLRHGFTWDTDSLVIYGSVP